MVARPPSAACEIQKAVRRNKISFAAGAVVFSALLLGIIATTWQSVRATHAKQQALAAQAQEAVQRRKAVEAQANETKLREQAEMARTQAEAAELVARQRAYASGMNVAQQALEGNNLGSALDLLNRQRPQPGQKDLRGWEWRYLWEQTHSDALSTLCQKTEINSLAASANGDWLAIGLVHKDGLFVYDLHTRQEVAQLAPGGSDMQVAFSPAESLLAFTSASYPDSGKEQDTLRLWNASTRQMVAEFPLDGPCSGLAFANDGRTLAASIGYGHITLWRMPDGTRLASYPSEQAGPQPGTGFAATSDLGLAAYGTGSGQIRVMDLHDGKELWSAAASKQLITALAFSPDGKTLASAAGFAESDIRLWDAAPGKEIGRLEGHKSWVGSIVFWPDGKKLASASADQTIRTWDLPNRKCLDVLRGHRLEVWHLALLPDYKTLVSGAKDGEVCLWDASVLHPHQPCITVSTNAVNWCFCPDSRSLLTVDDNGSTVSRWSGPDFQEREFFRINATDGVRGCFSPDGRFVAAGYANGSISVWDTSRRVLRRKFKVSDGTVHPLMFLAQGNRLVVWVKADNSFSEWDLEADREIQTWPAPVLFENFGASPDERLGIGVGLNGNVYVRKLSEQSNTNLPLDILEGCSVAFSPDGARLAVASRLGYARVWDTATWREEATLRGFLNAVNSVAFSPDSRRLATGGSYSGDALKLWDADSWQELLTLEGAGSLFGLTTFSPDGNAIGTLSRDGMLHIWHAPSWAEINAAEAKDPPSQGYGGQAKMETNQQ